MEDYKYSLEKLYEHTDNGLDILHKYLPESIGAEKPNKKFRLRDERTASATLYKNSECWGVKDFGSGEFFSPLQIYQMQTGFDDFYQALKNLCQEFGVSENSTYFEPNKTYKDKGDLPDDYFKIEVKQKVENPEYFSAFVTAELCEKYQVYELLYYEKVTSGKKVLMRVNSTEKYPIFCYSDNLEKWAKIYCPSEKKRTFTQEDGTKIDINFKHGYLGKKPEKYYHGLKRIKEILKIREEYYGKDTPEKEHLLPYIIICSGGSDGLTLASLSDDFFPLWGNSENDIIDYDTYNFLKKSCKNLVYLPDTDPSGIDFAYKYSKRYWRLPIVFIPRYYLGEKGKDFRDYVSFFTSKKAEKNLIASEFKKLLSVPVSCDFVLVNDKKYRISVRNLHYFLNTEGFFGFSPEFSTNDKANDTTDFLVKIEGFKLKIPTAKEVRDFCLDFLVRKGTTPVVLEMVQTCNALRGADLSYVSLYHRDIDFTCSGKDFQLFFFQNTIVKVTSDDISVLNNQKNNTFVWENSVIEYPFIKKEPFFEVYQTSDGINRVNITQKNCDFMNFVINTCRMHWDKEYLALGDDFRKDFILNSSYLCQEEQITQEHHFLGKCFAIGYLLHSFKRRGFEKFVYMMDDKIKEDMDESNGRSGKGLLMQGIKNMVSCFQIDGKNKNMFNNPHLLGSYNGEKLIFFDDMLNNETTHGFGFLFSMISEGIEVNPKNMGSYYVPYEKSPKIVGTYNHALRNPNNSTLGRILFVLFSDYYHYTSEVHQKTYQPTDDFSQPLFSGWNQNQWTMFFNFMLQCLQLYLKYQETPLLCPVDNLNINTLKSSMGDNFLEWAEGYFLQEKLNIYLIKREIYDDYKQFAGKMAVSAQKFRKNLENFCIFKNYEFNPKEFRGTDGRIIRTEYWNTQNGMKKALLNAFTLVINLKIHKEKFLFNVENNFI